MARVQRKHTKGQIDRAGHDLISLQLHDIRRDEAITIVDNWRSCHAYPLAAVAQTLKNRAKRIDDKALIAQRLKRRPSIEIKLRDNPNMKLSQMQDIGGCRAVMKNMQSVALLIQAYNEADSKAGPDRISLYSSNDYIKNPKDDGYRGYHFIARYDTTSTDRASFINQRIEIQIRSQLQHSWATAVETAQLFTGQALKTRVKTASKDWLRFFALTSSAFAFREKRPTIPGTPTNRSELLQELRVVNDRLQALVTLRGWATSIRVMDSNYPITKGQYLLRLDIGNKMLRVLPYEENMFDEAQTQYQSLEKEAESNPNLQIVMVAVDDIKSLKKAYPNYYLDTSMFMSQVEKEIQSEPSRAVQLSF